MDLIIYHNSCPDGFGAAYIAKLKYPEAELFSRDHGLEPPYEVVKGKDVLVVDFSWRTREQNDALAASAKSFRILDHHKTAQAVLEGVSYAVFDMERSGAGLAWDYLFGKDATISDCAGGQMKPFVFKTRPWWVNYVEDRDLWRHQLPASKIVNAYIGTLSMTIEAWSTLSKISIGQAADLGCGALAHIEHYVREAVKQAQYGILNLDNKRYSVAIVNVPYLNVSEVGNVLAAGADIGIGWFERSDGMTQFSLRSIGDIDVSEIAKAFNGGGHRNASGFQTSLVQGRYIVDTILNRDRSTLPDKLKF
jgi:uncharacterized protein